MDLKYIELENFRNFSNERIDLEESTIWILRGKNSSGKSTLACDALTYALFGKIKAMDEPADFRVKVDDIIKRGESNTEVRVDFAHKSDFYSVIRKRESSGSSSKETVTIYLNKRQIMDEEKKSIANRWIEKNLWTYNDFTNTTLILQDEMTKTLQMARAERKDYLERLFNIKNFEIMSERARERSKNLEADIRELDGAVKTDKDKVQDPLKLETKKVALKNILDSLTKQLGIAKKKKEEINKIKDDLRQIKIEEDNLVKEKKGLSDVINSLKTETSKLKKELDVIDKLLLTRAEIENKIKKIEKLEGELEKFTRLREELKELETDNKRWIKAIKKNKENLKKQLLQLENQINERKNLITDQEEEIKDLISKHDEIKNLEPKIDQLPKKKQELDQVKKTNQLYNDFLKQLSGKNSTLTAQISAKKKDMNKKRKTAENYESVKQELKIKKKNKLELEAKEAEKTGYLNDLEIINEKRSTVKSDIQVINTKISNHKSKISEYMNEIEEIKGLE